MSKTLTDFRAKHDPTYKVAVPEQVFRRDIPRGAKRYIITAAQNATPVEHGWWSVLEHMAVELGAELLVVPIRYKNPTSQWSGSQRNVEFWAEEVRPYLWNQRHAINSNLTLLADIKIQPTASSPLTGADALSLASSGIIAHTKLQFKVIPTPSNRMAKILTTTGACTVPNYTDSRAGRIAQFHHKLGATLVEVQGRRFFLRQLHYDAKSKSCTDLNTTYTAAGSTEAAPAAALVMGDTHVHAIDPAVVKATFGKGGIVEALKPQHLVWHDLLDAYSINPHHRGNPFAAIAKMRGKASSIAAEVSKAIKFVTDHTPDGALSIVVPSNHNDFLTRWIMDTDWRHDPANAQFYLMTALDMARDTRLTDRGTEFPDPFTLWMKTEGATNVWCLERDESFALHGIELGMHGDIGPSGVRGSRKNLSRIGSRSVIGHSHSPGIEEGCYQAGTSTRLKLEYNKGPGTWLNCHCVLLANGKRQLIVIVDGKWRL